MIYYKGDRIEAYQLSQGYWYAVITVNGQTYYYSSITDDRYFKLLEYYVHYCVSGKHETWAKWEPNI